MQYRLLATDIDGTLLTNEGKLTEKVKESIHKAMDRGVIFTLCTGRPIQGISKITEEIGRDIPVITYNGSMVITGKSKTIIYQRLLRPEDARQAIKLGMEYDVTIVLWYQNRLFVNRLDERAAKYSDMSGTEANIYEDPESIINNGITKILWYDDSENIERFEKEIAGIVNRTMNFHTSQPFFLEFVDHEASKAIAMEKLGNHYGITREEMIAVGDGFNDLSMIRYAGMGVAMGNANDAIKKEADFITKTNDEDGLEYVIEKFILKKF